MVRPAVLGRNVVPAQTGARGAWAAKRRGGQRMLGSGSVAIDLGTVNTLVWVEGRGIVLEEPSAIAVDDASGLVTAGGAAAGPRGEKEPKDIRVLPPLRDGVVADLDATTEMLHRFLR